MDELYGFSDATKGDVYADGALLMSSTNLMLPGDYDRQHRCHSMIVPCDDLHLRIPVFGSEDLRFQCSVASESACVDVRNYKEGGDEDELALCAIKAKIASHPSYPRLLDAYIDCQKVGAPPGIASLLDEIRWEKDLSKEDAAASLCFGVDPELDQFMETYCDMLVKYKSDLSRPFDEATSFLNVIEAKLGNLCNGEGTILSSDEELSRVGEITVVQDDAQAMKSHDQELKDRLLRRYGGRISSLKLEFSKKKKKGKLPKEARQTLLQWWLMHSKWPYPTEDDKIALAGSTGLDQKQINNWFINQRKRHWKSSVSMHLTVMDNNVSGHD